MWPADGACSSDGHTIIASGVGIDDEYVALGTSAPAHPAGSRAVLPLPFSETFF